MCCDDIQGRPTNSLRAKLCRKFIITDEEEMCRKFYVNIAQFQQQNEEIALCKILIHLSSKGLTINNRKFYMPKFNAIIETKSFCRIKLSALNEKQVILISYPKSKDNQEIIRENTEFEPIVIFPPKAFKAFTPSGFDLFSMAQENFNSTQTFNPNLVQSDCCCVLGYCSQGSMEDKIICQRKEPNQEIEYSFLYLQQEIRNKSIDPELKNELMEEEREVKWERGQIEEMDERDSSNSAENKINQKGIQQKHLQQVKQESESHQKSEKGPPTDKSEEAEKRSEVSSSHLEKQHSSHLEVKIQSSHNTEEAKPKEPVRRTREPQRKIAEVIVLTKIWRELHEKKGWSLIEAAKLVGISKKSLDDYFLVLRVGVIHNYDFAGGLTHGMGDLRAYIKQKDVKVCGKLHKTVQCFDLVPELNLDLMIEQYKNGESINLLV